MGDPQVIYLRYRLIPTADETEFPAESLDVETPDFSVHVGREGEGIKGPVAAFSTLPADASAGELRVRTDIEAVLTFKKQHRSEHAARDAVRPFLEAWELDEALRAPGKRPRFDFEFAGSLIIDRGPPPGKEATYAVSGGGSFYVRTYRGVRSGHPAGSASCSARSTGRGRSATRGYAGEGAASREEAGYKRPRRRLLTRLEDAEYRVLQIKRHLAAIDEEVDADTAA